MKIILLENIKGVGQKFDVKEVSAGYARNVLIPKGQAKLATLQELNKLAQIKNVSIKEKEEVIKHTRELATNISNSTLTFDVKTDKNGNLFGSVNKDTILKNLKAQGLVGDEKPKIHIDKPIKKIGDYVVEIDFKKGIKAKLKIKLHSQP